MVEVRTSRMAAETLADEGDVAGTVRQDVTVAADFTATVEARCSRMAIEVLAVEPDISAAVRQDVTVAANFASTAEARCSRMAIEVLAAPDAESSATRQDIQVGAGFGNTAEIRCSRLAMECLARQGSAGPVVPVPLMDDAHIFLHNWATKAEMDTSFRTSIASSPDSGAESRRGLNVKPFRTLSLEWMVCDDLSLDQLERLEVFLRRMTDQRFQVPIYMDQQELATSYLSADVTIFLPTNKSRLFPGQRVGIVQLDACNQPVSSTFHTIDTMGDDRLTFTASLGVDIAAGSYLFPIMDGEITLEVEAEFTTSRTPSIKVKVSEVPGASQLPPLKSDIPTGAAIAHDGRPVWIEEPDWSKGISKGRDRQGSRNKGGRADFVQTEGDRSRQTHQFQILGNRDDMWNALEFFETRRGRLRSFWHIDQDQYMSPVELDASGTFVGISEIGTLADIQEEFDAVGVVMADGTYFVRSVSNIQAILTVFRITMNPAIDAGMAVNDVIRVARARLVRFTKDEFRETWTHTGLMTARVSVIEVLNETDFTI